MKTLVTGSSGLIGTVLCDFLEKIDKDIVSVDRSYGSLTNIDTWNQFPRDITHVVHLAATITTSNFGDRSIQDVIVENIMMTANLMTWAESLRRIPKIIFASTHEIYYDGNPKLPVFEKDNISVNHVDDRWAYAWSKVICEKILGMRGTPARLCGVYGPNMKHNYMVKGLMRDISSATETVDVRSPYNTRQLLYVDDAVRGLICLLLDNAVMGAYNICSDSPISVLEVAQKINDLSGKNLNLNPLPQEHIDHRWSSPLKLNRKGWRAAIDLDEGLRRTWESYGHNPTD